MERYGISKKNAVGTVIWHSLNENAEIGVYDIKFGNTIVRNLSEADVKAVVAEEHGHSKRDDDDPERKKDKEEEEPKKKKARDPYAGIGDAYYKSGMYSGD